VVGAGCGVLDVAGNTLLAWSEPTSLLRSMNTLHLSFGVGAFSIPLLVAWSLEATGQLTAATLTIATLGLIVVWALQQPTPVQLAHRRDEVTASGATPWTPLLLVGIFFLLLVGVETSMAGWVATYVNDQPWSQNTQGPLFTAVFFAAFTGGRVITAAIGTRLTARVMLATTALLSIAGALVFVAGNGAQLAVWVSVVALGLANGPQYPMMMTYADEHLRLTGRATSVFVGCSAIGGISIPLAIGWLLDRQGNTSFPVTMLVATIGVLGCLAVINRATLGTSRNGINVIGT
jgi:fucose permease